ncbi:hypothetical protein OWR29_46715 [Actinoplanes sp. Pm04-4]|uniref:Uncharacterized protein n=1 Tax=Paractinoplanes pyxinae TaxID=2997416 RepID=A0ABT4BIW7_9ACTN|nr:hypothetical protein [Actinoplanes pyxinae]MCY1145543.1 hypothetical protein [Actinoplanes pyxinae]
MSAGPGVGKAVEIRGLVKTYGEFLSVDGLGMTVRRGACHGVVCPSGAGLLLRDHRESA